MATKPGLTRRTFLKTGLLSLAGISLLSACAPAAPAQPAEATRPTESAKPTEVAKPAAAAPTTAPAPAVSTKPATTAPAQTGAQSGGSATGQITIVNEGEPQTMVPKDAYQENVYFVMDNVYDHLTTRDYSSGVATIVPQLAESWMRVDPNTWRFKLRQGVTYTNGEKFNADAVVAAVEDMVNPAQPGQGASEYGTLKASKKIDEFTADIITKDPDPILPQRLIHFPMPAPNWLRTANLEASATQAVGSGPYILTEFTKGSQILLKANPNYWGTNKPKIAEVRLISRVDQTVRGAMLQAGEVDLAFNIVGELLNQVPRGIIQQTPETPMFRINHEHPVLKDVRVRQAIAYAVDVQSMIKSLYPEGIAVPVNGQLARQGTTGYNPNLKAYPYDPAAAKRLLQEAGAVGAPVEYVGRPSQFPRASEVSELVANWLNDVGLKATVRFLEGAAASEALRSVKPDQPRTDLHMTSVSNPVLDSSRAFDVYHACGGRNNIGCDTDWDRKYTEAKGLDGEARDKAFQGLWELAYDQYKYVPLFGLNWAHGTAKRLQWTPRLDGLVVLTEMSLTS